MRFGEVSYKRPFILYDVNKDDVTKEYSYVFFEITEMKVYSNL
jgi:hypothetical protein